MSKRGKAILEGLKAAQAYEQGTLTPAQRARFRVHVFDALDVARIRKGAGMTQKEFSAAFKIPLPTLRHWEQGQRVPQGPAGVLLRVIEKNPDAVLNALR
jgi:putative transcriptional regulator